MSIRGGMEKGRTLRPDLTQAIALAEGCIGNIACAGTHNEDIVDALEKLLNVTKALAYEIGNAKNMADPRNFDTRDMR